MKTSDLSVVTGALGYTGKYITRLLLSQGKRVRTITGHPDRFNPFGKDLEVAPFSFDNLDALAESLKGATTLYNTYWIRFPHGQTTYEQAVENSRTLIKAAEKAGVQRIVHISITNPSEDSSLPYFSGKALVEQAIAESSLSYAIIRPTVIFGEEDILINNIAWFLRKFPVFPVPGDGNYKVQPVFVGDLAEIAVEAASLEENTILDAVGPDTYTFDNLVRLIAENVQSRARIVHVRPRLAHFLSTMMNRLVDDVVLTWEEIEGLMGNLLISKHPATGKTHLGDWLAGNADSLGASYASELERHYR